MSIKKAELHVHLEGTITPQVARQLAHRNHLSIPEGLIAPDDQHYLSRDFLHFLNVFDTLAALIKTPQDYYDITYDYLKCRALEDTIYVEMMYSPDHAEQATGIPSIEHLHALQQAVNDAEAKFNIVGRILITAVRHFGEQACIQVAEQATKQTVPCVVGFALGGDEIHYPPQLFTRAFQIANDAGLYCTAHAGEFTPASGIIDAINCLPLRRVGHGVQAIHSPETIALLIERDIALELCPSSNIKLGLFPDFEHHPFPTLMAAGLKVSLNSDDPPFMFTSLGQEYAKVQQAYQYSDDTMRQITAMAIDCAFVDESTKQGLQQRLIVSRD
jgi:adenosine deaminase